MYAMKRTFKEEQIALIVEMVLHRLVILHDKQLIHRDIKGGNLLINVDGCAVGVQLDYNECMKCSLRGSPHWMS